MSKEEYKLLYYFTYTVLILSLLDRLKRMLFNYILHRVHMKKEKKVQKKTPPFNKNKKNRR